MDNAKLAANCKDSVVRYEKIDSRGMNGKGIKLKDIKHEN